MGPLSNPIPPDIPGLDTFTGHCFHSARWDHDHDLAGERVAVIGTGSSAAQFVPEIQPKVGRLLVFQRTPGWTFPRLNRRITAVERAMYRRLPLVQRAVRARQYLYRELVGFLVQHPGLIEPISKARMRLQVKDPELRAKLTPELPDGLQADHRHRRLPPRPDQAQRVGGHQPHHRDPPHVDRHRRRRRARDRHADPGHGVPGDAGGRPADRPGRSWRWPSGGPIAARRTWARPWPATPTTSCWWGPTPPPGTRRCCCTWRRRSSTSCRRCGTWNRPGRRRSTSGPTSQADFNRDVQARLASSVWTDGGCRSWYLDPDGGTLGAVARLHRGVPQGAAPLRPGRLRDVDAPAPAPAAVA